MEAECRGDFNAGYTDPVYHPETRIQARSGLCVCIMISEIEDLERSFEEYYSTEYSARDDTLENIKIRKRAVEILTSALKARDTKAAESILILLSESTGCAEDLAIFAELIEPLLNAHLISEEEIGLVTKAKPVARWR